MPLLRIGILLFSVGAVGPTIRYALGPDTISAIAAPAITGEPNLRKFLFLQIATINYNSYHNDE
jgi:hypothetical protein